MRIASSGATLLPTSNSDDLLLPEDPVELALERFVIYQAASHCMCAENSGAGIFSSSIFLYPSITPGRAIDSIEERAEISNCLNSLVLSILR